jgi:DNA polymerase
MATPGIETERHAPSAGGGLQGCRRCDLWKQATQAVGGEGPPGARIMLVGEQPGDEEDLSGRPFVGPAGRLLEQIMSAAGVRRQDVYMTNAVKHFKWEPRGKRRLHKKPTTAEVQACNLWLEGEIAAIRPTAIVALGATALQALGGAELTIDAARRQSLKHPGGARLLATYHPSAILRGEGPRAEQLRRHLQGALREAARLASRDPRDFT